MAQRDSQLPATSRRAEERHEVRWAVDCASHDTFLYAYITNVSSLGLFIYTERPLPIGTRMKLSFAPLSDPPDADPVSTSEGRAFELFGEVAWINPKRPDGDNPNPGMGVRFLDLSADDRERLVEVIHTIAYVRGSDRGAAEGGPRPEDRN